MKEIEGMLEDFKRSKVVFMTTYSDGKEHNRAMTNLNEDPYRTMRFPTYGDTVKVDDLKKNPKVMITFPASRDGEFYEVEGRGMFASEDEVKEKWQWWYLYWHPEQRDRFWFPAGRYYPNRVIIRVDPIDARKIKKEVNDGTRLKTNQHLNTLI